MWTRRLLARLRASDGFSLFELIAVMATLLVVLASLTAVFVAGAQAELDLNRRFQSQQNARVALDKLRREIHCASALTLTSASSVTVTLPAQCPTSGGTQIQVVYDTELVATSRYRLRRASVEIAEYLTSGNIFSYVAPSTSTLGKLHVDLPVNVYPNEGWKQWRLVDDIVLRNTTRA